MLIPAKQHKRKVYCVNCRYYIYSTYTSNDICVAPNNVLLEYKDSYERKSVQTTYLRHPRAKNRSNNCPDYKLSIWWRVINTFLALFRRGGGWNG
jgi:hypothetical protein